MTETTLVPCACAALRDIDVLDFWPEEVVRQFRQLAKRGRPQWWLNLRACPVCGQHWLVAQEERLNDVYVVSRIDVTAAQQILDHAQWPDTLDRYETLLKLGKQHGHAARYANPMELLPVVIDLVGQSRGIPAEEIADLVNVSLDDATGLIAQARLEVQQHGYPYPWKPK
jgi:hypothetical protein